MMVVENLTAVLFELSKFFGCAILCSFLGYCLVHIIAAICKKLFEGTKEE